jgi:hypothetical protein
MMARTPRQEGTAATVASNAEFAKPLLNRIAPPPGMRLAMKAPVVVRRSAEDENMPSISLASKDRVDAY